MSVQGLVKSTVPAKPFPSRPHIGRPHIGRLILGQVIAVFIVIVAGWNYWGDLYSWVQTQDIRLHAPETRYLGKLPLHILIHIGGAATSLCLGGYVLYARKGTANHKVLGRIWVAAMVTTSISSFFMHSFAPLLGQFGPIHLLSVWILVSMPRAILMARKGDIVGHMQVMRGSYIGLVIAGIMTFIPGRVMFAMFFG
jgi:uncharacterized membrane protein